jgi:hypothetical protein
MKAFSDDPLEALGDRNWLSPGSALMRTERVPAELFAGTPRYLEWTYLAVQLASTCRLLFDDRATFVYDEDAPNRVSRSAAYLFGQPAALERILALDLPGGLREKLERDHSGALHAIAQERLERRELAAAWRAHLSSLLGRGGLRFFLSTRKFLGLP